MSSILAKGDPAVVKNARGEHEQKTSRAKKKTHGKTQSFACLPSNMDTMSALG